LFSLAFPTCCAVASHVDDDGIVGAAIQQARSATGGTRARCSFSDRFGSGVDCTAQRKA
jgi:hypothetical protein